MPGGGNQSIIMGINMVGSQPNDATRIFSKPTTDQREQGGAIADYFEAAIAGLRKCTFGTIVNNAGGVAATGTIVFSAANSVGDTIIINGVTFTAVASGATGNHFNVGSSATTQANLVAQAINAASNSLVNPFLNVNAASGTVTFTATQIVGLFPLGSAGNLITIAKGVDSGSVMTVSGARLTGGVDASPNLYHLGA
jgi:hypothetical protein